MNADSTSFFIRGARFRASLAAVALAGALGVSGCATQAELHAVRNDQKEVRGLLADQQVALDKLRRQVETFKADLDDARRSGRSRSAGGTAEARLDQLEARLAAIEQAPVTTPSPVAPSLGSEPPPAAPREVTPVPRVEPTPPAKGEGGDSLFAREEAALQNAKVDDTYREAVQLARRGEYNQAIPRFREFLRKNPKSDYAASAQYWIGESYYALRDYNRAILEFNEVLLKYPKAEKVPPSLYRQALAFAELGDKVDARLILQKLISEHPRSEEAERAKQKLPSLTD